MATNPAAILAGAALPTPLTTTTGNPFGPIMHPLAQGPAAPAPGAPATPILMTPGGGVPFAHPMIDPNMWRGLAGQGLLNMFQRLQVSQPDRFAQMMSSPLAARFGITPDNLATMQSRQAAKQGAYANAGFGGGGFGGGNITPGGTATMPTLQPTG